MPRVSVIIPTYNRSYCIERSVKSVQNQTFKDIEILVCDDASTDQTLEIVYRLQKKDSRIRVLKLSSNKGPAEARNLGMKEAAGEYIAFLDSDDEWLEGNLSSQIKAMDASPVDTAISLCGARIIKDGKENKPELYRPKKSWERDTLRKFAAGDMIVFTPTLVFRRSCILKTGLMNPEMRQNEDREFLIRLFMHFKLIVLPDVNVQINLVVSSKLKKTYDNLKLALPNNLKHYESIKRKLGYWSAIHYKAHLFRILTVTAIREKKWREALKNLAERLKVFPVLFPRDLIMLMRAFGSLAFMNGKKNLHELMK